MKLGVSQSLVQSDTGQQLHPSRAGAARLGRRIITFAFAVLAAAGTAGLLVVRLFWLLMVRLRSRGRRGSARWDRPGNGGGGGGGRGTVVEVLQLQFIDKVVDVLMQLKFQQSRACTGSSSTECWTCQLRTERYPQCTLYRRLFLASTSL